MFFFEILEEVKGEKTRVGENEKGRNGILRQ